MLISVERVYHKHVTEHFRKIGFTIEWVLGGGCPWLSSHHTVKYECLRWLLVATVGKEYSCELLSFWDSSVVLGQHDKPEMVSFDGVFLDLCKRWLVIVENKIDGIIAISFANLYNLGSFLQVVNHLVEDSSTILSFSTNQLRSIFPDLKSILESTRWLTHLGEIFRGLSSDINNDLFWNGNGSPCSWVELTLI